MKAMTKQERQEQRERRRARYAEQLATAQRLYPIGTEAESRTIDGDYRGRVTGYCPAGDGRVLVVLDGRGAVEGWVAYLSEMQATDPYTCIGTPDCECIECSRERGERG